MENEKVFVCCLCGHITTGWGNDPWPCKPEFEPEEGEEAQCCDECNSTKVIPARLRQIYGEKGNDRQ